MAQHKVMKLWTAIVTAFLALCTALGLVTAATATTAAAASKNEGPRTGTAHKTIPTSPTIPAPRHWSRSHASALPPTMKQRIRAEAHGKTPSCRHLPLADNQSETATTPQEPSAGTLDC
ncbi:hypothetical protein BFF78_21150 [Streptomyces fodineus]|uniref:Secreted protein n=1 Tax=Streptomyces fodineus TaxID=1904616 RepID=A0A1D7YC91_9ACTN|nr:DUF6344 domain-containing protein [Streptomyces fodineus]AOR33238.1 hypothetical protein BFF78_21150 [Streptomyces fodineus]